MRDTDTWDWSSVLRAAKFALRDLIRTQAPVMAAALAFRTLFGMLPVLVMGTLLLKAALGDEFPETVASLVGSLGLQEIQVIPPAESGAAQASPIGLGEWVEELVTYAAGLNLAAIGWIGLVVVMLSALWVMVTIEESFNAIYRAPGGRPWMRRLLVYWFVLTVGPLALGAAPVALRGLSNLAQWTDEVPLPAQVLGWAISFCSAWGLMYLAYVTVPNARVRPRPAMGGALVAAILLVIGERSLGAYLEHAFSVSRLYGALGLVPLFMFWVYLMWLFVLYGLQVSAILQSLGDGTIVPRARCGAEVFEPARAIAALQVIGDRFSAGQPTRPADVARACGTSQALGAELLDAMRRRGLLVSLDATHPAYAPARPIEQLSASEALQAAFDLADRDSGPPTLDSVIQMRRAQLVHAHPIPSAAPATTLSQPS